MLIRVDYQFIKFTYNSFNLSVAASGEVRAAVVEV